ncbi:DUF222 domain-containing protein [Gordonia iterans]
MDAVTLVAMADALSDELTEGVARDRPGDAEPSGLGEFLTRARAVDDDREVLAVAAALLRLRNVVDHGLACAVAAAERMAIPARKRVRSGAALLMGLGAAPAVAMRAARLGSAVDRVEVVSRSMRDGAVSAEFGDAVVRGMSHVDRRVDGISDAEREAVITSLMVQTTPAQVAAKAREWAIAMSPEEADEGRPPVAEDAELNEMTLRRSDDGRVEATLDLDVLAGEELFSAIDPLCRPVPDADGSPDPRSAAQRRADALGEVVRTYLSGSNRPESGGVLPHVTMIVPAAERGGVVDGERRVEEGGAGERTTVSHAGDAPGGEGGGDSAGGRVRRVPRVPTLGFCGAVSARTAELVMCEASVCAALVSAEGVPLFVGRAARLMTPGIRKALAVRDRGCAFPGCGKPVSHCDAHHAVEWKDGGPTSLDNGVLLCRRHHGWIHQLGWEVYIGADRHPWFVPPVDPEHPDRPREAMRSHARRTLTCLPEAA